jgi:polyhydroxyalkanoate synthase
MNQTTTQGQETARAVQEEGVRNLHRIANWMEEFVIHPENPPMASTPKDLVWKRRNTSLFRYRPQASEIYPVPIIIVPWLGISRTTVLDLLPGHSFLEFLVKRGYDTYLLDWGEFGEEDRDFGFEDAVCKILPRAIDEALETSEASEVTLNGICLGGTVTASYLGLEPDAPVRNAINMVSPIDFDEGGLFRAWLDGRFFPADLMVQRFGGIPPSLMGTGFKMLRPTLDLQAYSGLWFNLDRKDYIPVFKAMNQWATDFIMMPGRFFSQLAKELYAQNKLIKGEFVLRGKTVDL